MGIENIKNRDLFLKICFMNFLTHILKILGIDEEIEEVMPTEIVDFEIKEKITIFDNLLDFKVLTKSGKIIIFEFKKNSLTTKDLSQVFGYCDRIHCKKKRDVISIIIVLSKRGKLDRYSKLDITYHPRIIKTKTIDKRKDLKVIRDKLEHNRKLTSEESSLLVALPLFDIDEDESAIVEEVCNYIKNKKNCICEKELDGITLGMYFNILEYVDLKKQDELMGKINMVEKYEGVIAQIKNKGYDQGYNRGFDQGFNDCKAMFIRELLKSFSIVEIAEMVNMDVSELNEFD